MWFQLPVNAGMRTGSEQLQDYNGLTMYFKNGENVLRNAIGDI